MGTDIGGFVEVRPGWGDTRTSGWQYLADLDHLYDGRSYDLFGCLFGVRNFAGFRPVAPDRGIPADVSSRGSAEWDTWGPSSHNPTWVGWDELAAIDLDEAAERPDSRFHAYRLTPDGPVFESKFSYGRDLAALIEASGMTPAESGAPWPVGTEWSDGEHLYRIERLTRRDVLPGAMSTAWKVMAALAELHGAGHVRLVVWFDS